MMKRILCLLALITITSACNLGVVVIEDFESGVFDNWTIEGEAFYPQAQNIADYPKVSGVEGTYFFLSDSNQFQVGTMTSKNFTINRKYINFLTGVISRRDYANNMTIALVVDNKTVRSTSPFSSKSGELSWASWNVEEFNGKEAHILIDIKEPYFKYAGGSLLLDQIEMGSKAKSTYIGNFTQKLVAKNDILLIPSQDKGRLSNISVVIEGINILGEDQVINLAQDTIDYYIPIDIRKYKGQNIEINYTNMRSDYLAYKSEKQADSYNYDMNEQYRPIYHFSPNFGWTNDPNGMVYSNGEYHLAYQANPYGVRHNNMHWGNAISKDLVHWTDLPFIVAPDELGAIFSGSSVEDTYNSAGFGEKALVGMYTSAGIQQQQSIAYSIDGGLTYTKYPNNPVISDLTRPDFRDPKIIRYKDKWVVAIAAGEVIAFYESKNLIDWTKISEFGKGIGSHAAVWECPDLFPLQYKGQTKWVLLVSINPGGPNGGSVTQYFIGNFNGKEFKADPLPYPLWLDCGVDNYAGVTFANTGNRSIFMGWMSNWQYTNDVPTQYFRNAMTIARDLSLKHNGSHLFLASSPSPEIEAARQEELTIPTTNDQSSIVFNQLPKSGAYEICFTITPDKDQKTSLKLKNSLDEEMHFSFDFRRLTVSLDRSRSGKVDFNKNFKKTNIITQLVERKEYKVRLFVDKHSTELFINDGDLTFTNTMFPNETYTILDINTLDSSSNVSNLKVYELK